MGHCKSYIAVPFFWTKHVDLSIRCVGMPRARTSWIAGDLASRDGLVRFVKGERLLAVATVERDMAASTRNATGNRRRPAQRRLTPLPQDPSWAKPRVLPAMQQLQLSDDHSMYPQAIKFHWQKIL
jgi:hypothetical protein